MTGIAAMGKANRAERLAQLSEGDIVSINQSITSINDRLTGLNNRLTTVESIVPHTDDGSIGSWANWNYTGTYTVPTGRWAIFGIGGANDIEYSFASVVNGGDTIGQEGDLQYTLAWRIG